MASFIKFIGSKIDAFIDQFKDHTQKQSKLNALPYDIQFQIFSFIHPKDLAKLSVICKEWKMLTRNPLIWKAFCLQLGLAYISENPMIDYRFGLACAKLKLKENLGEAIFHKIEQMPVWEEEVDCKCAKGTFEQGEVYYVSDLTIWQNKADKKDHFGKKIVGQELFLIFVKADRWKSVIFRFNLNFSSSSLDKDEFLYWQYGVGSTSGFYLDKKDKAQKRSFDLSFRWQSLQTEFNELFGLKQKEVFNFQSHLVNALDFYLQRDVLHNKTYNKPDDL